jgi:hypothetical protein
MTRAEEYRYLATKVRARASDEESPIAKAGWENLASSYIRLAEQSEESDPIDVFYDPIIGILGGSRH